MSDRAPWQQEYDALPAWAQDVIDALRHCVSHGSCSGPAGGNSYQPGINFKSYEHAAALTSALRDALPLAYAQSAPWPRPEAPARERRAVNVVEFAAEGDDCAFDQPCCFGHRVESHAVYCHNEAWPDGPRKCRRNRDDFRHEDCPGFVANPDVPE